MSRFEELVRHYAGKRVGKAVSGGIVLVLGALIFLGQPALGVFIGAIGLVVLIWSLMSEPREEQSGPEGQGVGDTPYQVPQQEIFSQPVGQAQQHPIPSGQLPFSAPQAGIGYGQQPNVGQGNDYGPVFSQSGAAPHHAGQAADQQYYGNQAGRSPQPGLYGWQAPDYGYQSGGGTHAQQNSPYGQR